MTDPFDAYTPTKSNPWTLAKAGHLLRRATFGPTRAELLAALRDGPEATVTRLVQGVAPTADELATSEFTASERSLPQGAGATQLAAWWLGRILRTGHPLREKLTLFWHNHFATSVVKVRNARLMLGQYQLLHAHALGDFRALLTAMATDPAMLVWLDGATSAKGAANENYARELMELFALGRGPYTEADVREAARAFTGYEVTAAGGKLNPRRHDAGPKTVLGRTGNFAANDVTNLCLDHPACPRFLVAKLLRELVSDTAATPPVLVEPLAKRYRESGYDTGKLVETILRSEYFFAAGNARGKVKAPVEFAVGIVRGLGASVGPLKLAQGLENLGQQLFAPPSVKGWDGGPAWLNAQTLLGRQNLALALTEGDSDLLTGLTANAEIVDRLLETFLQNGVPAATRRGLIDYLDAAPKAARPVTWTADDAKSHRLRSVTHLVLALPEFQLA